MKADENPTRTDTAIAGIELALCIKELKRVSVSSGCVRVNQYYPLKIAIEHLETIQKEFKQ